jgi:multisubunit Na+/H+ antiporter MnhC subunit
MENKLKTAITLCIFSSILVIIGVILLLLSNCSWKFITGLFLILWANNIGLINRK